MMQTFDIARMQWASVKVAHCLYPALEAREFSSISEPGSIGVAFTAQSAAAVQREDRAHAELRDVPANSVALCGAASIHWLRTAAASELVEITAPGALRREIAQSMGVGEHADLDDLHGWFDAPAFAAALCLRAATRGWSGLSDIARDELVRCLYAHVYRRQFGGRWPGGGPKALSAPRLDRLIEFVGADLAAPLDIPTLAQVVALSPFHFARAFKASTGMPPHRFVTLLRLQRARQLLHDTGASVADVAAAVGYSNLNHFRRMFRVQNGRLPAAARRVN